MRPKAATDAKRARPFLKWAGGKTQLLDDLQNMIPDFGGRYYEPFLGGGAFFFALASGRAALGASLNDLNLDLVKTYTVVRDNLPELLDALGELSDAYITADTENRVLTYYQVRRTMPSDPVAVAARLIFLNKTCFNGLYRVNRDGQFNVPHGRYANPKIRDVDRLTRASECLQTAVLTSVDFAEVCANATEGDLVYFDPPYHPLTTTSSFTAYTDRDFGEADQVRLRECVDALTERRVRVMISNSSHPWLEELYRSNGYDVSRVQAARAINSRGDRRGPVEELLITNDSNLPLRPA